MINKLGYVPQKDRKKILLICDDIRVHSGVATVARELVVNSAHHFNWVNVAGAIQHPEVGKRVDISADTNNHAGIDDASVMLYPTNGYGDAMFIRQLLELEKPDAIFLITDPRYFTWLFNIENEIRKKTPIVYLNIWDDLPAPHYNKAYYEACDVLLGISKQTVNINKLVLGDKAKDKIIKYVPHGLNEKVFKPLTDSDPEWKEFQLFKKQFLKNKEYDFTLFFNSRNIRRKQIPDTMMAFKLFLDSLPLEKAKKCALILHTDLVSDHGTDLIAVKELLFEGYEDNIIFSTDRRDSKQMNFLYNLADAQILLTSNEGWGLSLTEAMLAGLPIIANVTGGMQDQMRFENDKGEWIDFDDKIPSNHRGTYKKHGKWAFPIFPSNISIMGSPPTPYIFDDRCRPEDATEAIKELYWMSTSDRVALGLEGREWAMSDEAGFTSEKMANRAIEAMDKLFATWKPRERFEFINTNEVKKKVLNHALIY
jgi:glycosyltransferase involved in cell wall biosynthesis